jgi:hypothetical protein
MIMLFLCEHLKKIDQEIQSNPKEQKTNEEWYYVLQRI